MPEFVFIGLALNRLQLWTDSITRRGSICNHASVRLQCKKTRSAAARINDNGRDIKQHLFVTIFCVNIHMNLFSTLFSA